MSPSFSCSNPSGRGGGWLKQVLLHHLKDATHESYTRDFRDSFANISKNLWRKKSNIHHHFFAPNFPHFPPHWPTYLTVSRRKWPLCLWNCPVGSQEMQCHHTLGSCTSNMDLLGLAISRYMDAWEKKTWGLKTTRPWKGHEENLKEAPGGSTVGVQMLN